MPCLLSDEYPGKQTNFMVDCGAHRSGLLLASSQSIKSAYKLFSCKNSVSIMSVSRQVKFQTKKINFSLKLETNFLWEYPIKTYMFHFQALQLFE